MKAPTLPRFSLAVALLTAAACAGTDEGGPKAPGEGPQKRDTTIKHESCDSGSSSAKKIDVNGDGKPDIIHVMDGSREVCRIVDLNLDGKVDAYIYYDEKGNERRRESDFDRDGRADEIAHYKDGRIVLKERETNFDNKIDTWDYYEGDRLVRRERDSDGDGIIDQWWTFNNPQNPKCAVVARARGGDGKPDPESVVDLCADPNAPTKPTAPTAPATPATAQPVAPAPAASVAPVPPAPSAAPKALPSSAPAAPPPKK